MTKAKAPRKPATKARPKATSRSQTKRPTTPPSGGIANAVGVAIGFIADGYLGSLTFDVVELVDAVVPLLEALDHAPWPSITSWESPIGEPREGSLLDALRAGEVEQQVKWRHGDDVWFSAAAVEGVVWAHISIFDCVQENAWRWIAAVEELFVRLLENDAPVYHAKLEREGAGVKCIPRFELLGGASYLVIAHDAALADTFVVPERAIADGGWESRRIGSFQVLSRAIHAETNVELLEAIYDGQWAMARWAKPDAARYDSMGPPRPEEIPLVQKGEPQVLAVGYEKATETAIFSCAPQTHIQGWEIYTLHTIVQERRLPSGEAVARVEVLVPDRRTASRESRPLLDIGVHVLFYDDDGARKELE